MSDSIGAMALRFAKALTEHALGGFQEVDMTTYVYRMDHCARCPNYHAETGRCRLCGCLMETKTRWAEQSCPDTPKRWDRHERGGHTTTDTHQVGHGVQPADQGDREDTGLSVQDDRRIDEGREGSSEDTVHR